MHKFIFLYFLIMTACAACQSRSSSSDGIVLSKEFEDALKNNDTALAKRIAQKELRKIRSSITDSSFAALIDAGNQLQSLEFNIQKLNTVDRNLVIADSLVASKEDLEKLYSCMKRVYSFAAVKSVQKTDIDYYTEKLVISCENWISNNFKGKTKKELQVSRLKLQKDIAIASAIINNVDSKEIRTQTEDSYNLSIKQITASN